MPQVGQDIDTAIIVAWHKKEHDTVNKGTIASQFLETIKQQLENISLFPE